MNGLALFAGAGGLELGVSLAIGKHYRPIAYVEREATSAAVLAANMERGWLDKAPIWDDITTFTGDVVSPLVDNIDIVTAGFPCQPWSVAGKRRGTDDERWLWHLIFRLVCEIRPPIVFLENVPGILHGGIEHVLGDLSSIGFDAEWTCVRASDVGAPHRRERVFILANTESQRSGRKRVSIRSGEPRQTTPDTDRRGATVGNTPNLVSEREQPERTWGREPKETTGSCSRDLVYSDEQRLQRWGRFIQRGNEWIPFPPSPSDTDAWTRILAERPDLAPATKPEIRGVVDGMARGLARNDQLRILGNGVVPQQAAFAYKLLNSRLKQRDFVPDQGA